MPAKDPILMFEEPHLTVKLHERLLEVDVADGARRKLENVLEANSPLRESLGFLLQTAIPLDVPLSEIRSVSTDKKGRVKVEIPLRKDLTFSLDPDNARTLVEKLNELVPNERARVAKEKVESKKEKARVEPQRVQGQRQAFSRTVR